MGDTIVLPNVPSEVAGVPNDCQLRPGQRRSFHRRRRSDDDRPAYARLLADTGTGGADPRRERDRNRRVFPRRHSIATPIGETPVEALSVGDLVRTASGRDRAIKWIGTGQVLATPGRRTGNTPVIVRKGALADAVPSRDLRLTKGHSLFLDGVLIPVEHLVNHRSIIWDERAREVTIYHVELETHDVLIADGAPAESYRDDGNRWQFRNANSGWCLPPQPPCAPVLTGGPIVDAVWRRLVDRIPLRNGPPLTREPDLHLLVDGKRIDAIRRSDSEYAFRFTATPRNVASAHVPRCRKRSAQPAMNARWAWHCGGLCWHSRCGNGPSMRRHIVDRRLPHVRGGPCLSLDQWRCGNSGRTVRWCAWALHAHAAAWCYGAIYRRRQSGDRTGRLNQSPR